MIFLNVTWMEKYDGLGTFDKTVKGGGSFVDKYGYGHEMFNFRPIAKRVYGFVQAGSINLEKLGASKDDDYIEGVTVVFTAKDRHQGGTRIVGWYENATVYRKFQNSNLPERFYNDEYFGYFVEANEKDAFLLGIDWRSLFPKVPRGKGGMGQANIWYADSECGEAFKKEVTRKIQAYKSGKLKKAKASPVINVEARKEVEKIAIKTVTQYYEKLGFAVRSREKENVGWDLDVTNEQRTLKVEVKGLSGKEISVDLSRNEYEKMTSLRNRGSYVLSVVTNCRKAPTQYNFSYVEEKGIWQCDEGYVLSIEELVSAKCFVPQQD